MAITPAMESITSRLAELSARGGIDAQQLLDLAAEASRADPDRVWFSVDAGLIQRLGAELVAKQETAVVELIKNAFDADATRVFVTFEKVNRPGGTLTISDNGSGMTRSDLVNGFMRISTANKVALPTSPRFSRQRAGRKGIGRFAAQRLGSHLVLTTRVQGATSALRLDIDWSRFSANEDLSSVAAKIEPVEDGCPGSGTTLEIRGLREAWTDAQISRVYRYVMRLLRPDWSKVFAGGPPVRSREDEDVFNVEFLWPGVEGDAALADETTMFLDHALAQVEVFANDAGKAVCRVRSDRLGIADEIETEWDMPASARATSLRLVAHYFIIDDQVPGLLRGRVRDLLHDVGGIRVFRNGFRVPPYGDPDDDWLGLDFKAKQRSVLPPLANFNWYGFVSVDDPSGRWFDETSSRERLVENEEFSSVRTVLGECLVVAVLRIAEARGRKARAGGGKKKTSDSLRELAQEVRDGAADGDPPANPRVEGSLTPGDSDEDPSQLPAPTPATLLADIAIRLEVLADQVASRERVEVEEADMIRVLASLGLLIGQFAHEIRHLLVALQGDFAVLGSSGDANTSADGDRMARSRANLKRMATQAAYFDRAFAETASRETRRLDLREVLRDFRALMLGRAAERAIAIELKAVGARLFTPPMHSAELASILMNLYTNAEKAIARLGRPGTLLLCARRENDDVCVDVCDTGPGIPVESRERVFEAFFTTSSPQVGPEGGIVGGTGLGLKIVRDIVRAQGGDVLVVDPPAGFSTCVTVRLPGRAGLEGG